MDQTSTPSYEFEGFRLDTVLQVLFSPTGEPVALPSRAFETLRYLVERSGELVDKSSLMKAVWPRTAVEENNLSQCIFTLRKVLGEAAGERRFILTVPGRGFKFVAAVNVTPNARHEPHTNADPSVRQAGPAPADPLAASDITAATHSRGGLWVVLVLAAALAIGYPIVRKLWPSKQATTAGQETSAATVGVGEASVAVLPFVDMSDNKDQEYFADELSEVLIDQLAMVPGLHVPAQTSSFYFKGKQATVPEIAKALGVAHLLEGTVRKAGNTLRITAQLVRVDNGYQVWSSTFDRPLTDVFKIQDEIAGAVVQVLKMSILNHYVPEAARTTNIEAYTLYFRAHSSVVSNGSADYDAAAEHLHSALTLDPHFAAAWGWLALVTIWKFEPTAWGSGMRASPTQAACADARSAADRALELDSTLVQSHRAKGIVFQYCDNNLLAAEREFRRALELQPRSSDALRSYAWLVLASGRLDLALQLAQRAVSLDPLNSWNFAALGDVHWTGGRFAEAEAAYRKAVELGPTTAGLHALLANILLSTHKAAEAVVEAEREPDPEWRETALLFALDAAGRKSDADREIAAYELKYADDDPGGIAAFYACRHDTERTIRWLSRFLAKHQGEYQDLPNREACFKNVESDSTYKALRQKLKLP
jgi:TolB-like protein/DNA-binding winged helix-turn-helix (wHTH) protein/Tfp pilus assembly protein PilF